MTSDIAIRRARPSEHSVVRRLVQTVVDETYGGLWAPPPLQIDEEDWSLAWIGLRGPAIAGMALTHREWLSDLWVPEIPRRWHRQQAAPLQGRSRDCGRGFALAKLRVVQSNANALSFYAARGWTMKRGSVSPRAHPHRHGTHGKGAAVRAARLRLKPRADAHSQSTDPPAASQDAAPHENPHGHRTTQG